MSGRTEAQIRGDFKAFSHSKNLGKTEREMEVFEDLVRYLEKEFGLYYLLDFFDMTFFRLFIVNSLMCP
jgi:aminopeptidase N